MIRAFIIATIFLFSFVSFCQLGYGIEYGSKMEQFYIKAPKGEKWGGWHWFIIPFDIDSYKFLNHHPTTAFSFVATVNENMIDKITVKEWLKGRLDSKWFLGYFENIKGFEKYAAEIKNLDEFGIVTKKGELINALKSCYRNYQKEYERFLEKNYTFLNTAKDDNNNRTIIEKYSGIEIQLTHPINVGTKKFLEHYYINRDDYNFDHHVLSTKLFVALGDCYRTWVYYYQVKTRDKSKHLVHYTVPDSIKVPISFENAQKIFGKEKNAFVATYVTVKPLQGMLFDKKAMEPKFVSNLKIIKITKKFYRNYLMLGKPNVILNFDQYGNLL